MGWFVDKTPPRKSASINLVPYHAMGLVFRHDGASYAMILLFASNFANHGDQ